MHCLARPLQTEESRVRDKGRPLLHAGTAARCLDAVAALHDCRNMPRSKKQSCCAAFAQTPANPACGTRMSSNASYLKHSQKDGDILAPFLTLACRSVNAPHRTHTFLVGMHRLTQRYRLARARGVKKGCSNISGPPHGTKPFVGPPEIICTMKKPETTRDRYSARNSKQLTRSTPGRRQTAGVACWQTRLLVHAQPALPATEPEMHSLHKPPATICLQQLLDESASSGSPPRTIQEVAAWPSVLYQQNDHIGPTRSWPQSALTSISGRSA